MKVKHDLSWKRDHLLCRSARSCVAAWESLVQTAGVPASVMEDAAEEIGWKTALQTVVFLHFLKNRWRADGRLVCGQPETLLVYEYSVWHSSDCVKSWLRAAFRQFTFWHDSLKTAITGCHYLSSFKLPLNIYLSVLLNITSHLTLYNYEQVLLFYLCLLYFFSLTTQK